MKNPPRIKIRTLQDGSWSALLPDGHLLVRDDQDALMKEIVEWIGENGTPVDDLMAVDE